MKYAIPVALVLLCSCKKEEQTRVVVKIWADTCSVDYYNGDSYVHDTLGTLNDTIGPVVQGNDTVGWNVNVQPKHYFEYSYEGRRVYVKTRGVPGFYSYIVADYGDGKKAFKASGDGETEALIDINY